MSYLVQAGPAGILTHKEVFTSIYNTIKQVFKCKTLIQAICCEDSNSDANSGVKRKQG